MQRNPTCSARIGHYGLQQNGIPGVDFHKRSRPRGHAPSLVEMDYQFPGEENSKRTNKSDLTGTGTGASILHSAKGLEDHSCIRYTLKVLVGPCWKPLRVEIVRLARLEPHHRGVKFSLHIQNWRLSVGRPETGRTIRMLPQLRTIHPKYD